MKNASWGCIATRNVMKADENFDNFHEKNLKLS